MNFQPISHLNSDEIAAFQTDKLKSLLAYLQQHSPFYKEYFAIHSVNITAFETIEQLKYLPTTSKQQLAENNDDFLCCSNTSIADYCTTSGTTGKPVTIALTERDLGRLAYNEMQSFLTAGCRKGDVFQLMLTLDRQFMAGIAYYNGIRMLGGSAVRSGAVSPALQWENIFRYRSTVLVAVPSFILKMIAFAEENNIDLSASVVERIICIGEPVRNVDLKPNELAQRITSKWKVKLFSTYASTEMQTAFTECVHQCGNHLRPELLIAEVLDDEGRQVLPGTAGELTITTLDVEGMPLLRYRTGDVVTFYTNTCSCGNKSIRISPVIGRKNQMIKYRGTTIFPAAVFDALSSVGGVNDFILEVWKSEFGTDELLVHIPDVNDTIVEAATTALQAKLRVKLNVVASTAEAVSKLRPAESRKPIKVVFR